jgi:hypothetical protein
MKNILITIGNIWGFLIISILLLLGTIWFGTLPKVSIYEIWKNNYSPKEIFYKEE